MLIWFQFLKTATLPRVNNVSLRAATKQCQPTLHTILHAREISTMLKAKNPTVNLLLASETVQGTNITLKYEAHEKKRKKGEEERLNQRMSACRQWQATKHGGGKADQLSPGLCRFGVGDLDMERRCGEALRLRDRDRLLRGLSDRLFLRTGVLEADLERERDLERDRDRESDEERRDRERDRDRDRLCEDRLFLAS